MTASTGESVPQSKLVYRHANPGKDREENDIDYRNVGGPRLTYLWCDGLHGQTLYLGGEVADDGKIYFIPGHSTRVMKVDPETDVCTLIGPELPGKYKWLRGFVVGDCIYGLPCHADTVLRIHVPSQQVTTIPIQYEEFYEDKDIAKQQRAQEWKYHGGNRSPIDGCIYCIPQSASHVLKIDPQTEDCSLVGPELPGRYKWYGGVVGKQDKAIYGIPHNSPHVLRILPDNITLHGDFGAGGHKWHGASVAPNGTIVGVPANADTVLCITPHEPEPILTELGDTAEIQTGRHRTDRKYKYLGAMTGTDGMVYVFPSGSERVLQVDTASNTVQSVGPNLYDSEMERLCQNKWQNGLVSVAEQCVYAIPLAAESILRIDCSTIPPDITTWPLPAPERGLAKWEGGVVAPNGVIYTVPNNHKAVLRIEAPASRLSSASTSLSSFACESSEDFEGRDMLPYKSGIPTLRSSAHRVKLKPVSRIHDPKPRNRDGSETNTTWLPPEIRREEVFNYDHLKHDLKGALSTLLKSCDSSLVGDFRDGSNRLEDFVVPAQSTWRNVNGGHCELAQKYLSNAIASSEDFLKLFDTFVTEFILPRLKKRLVDAGAIVDEGNGTTFFYQRPPTIRLQPGPAWASVNAHNDAVYGHQNGELNFWIPFTDREMTSVDLWCESEQDAGDFHPIKAQPGQVISFHGSSCHHYVNANPTPFTRVSMDFRVGVEGFFDPYWQMQGTSDDHGRKEVNI